MVAISAALPIHRLDVEQYGQVVASGALDDQRVELIDGVLVDMTPHSPQHSGIIQRLTEHLSGVATGLRVQLPLQVAADSIPEPDLALVDQPPRMDRHPTSAVLVVEVAASSYVVDRGRKAELYAAAGIETYWLVDIGARAVEVRTDPAPAGYRTLRTFESGETLPSPGEGVRELSVDALFHDI